MPDSGSQSQAGAPEREAPERAHFEFEYAWGWFQYHAGQRLTAFNFFLVLVGLLFVTYAQAVHHGWPGVGFAIGMLGALVAIGFWALDIRNEELIAGGWTALCELEKDAGVSIAARSESRADLTAAIGRSPVGTGLFRRMIGPGRGGRTVFKHRTWLRLIMAAVGVAFAVGAIWAFIGYPGSPEGSTQQRPAAPESRFVMASEQQRN
jgi:hypothetical protein